MRVSSAWANHELKILEITKIITILYILEHSYKILGLKNLPVSEICDTFFLFPPFDEIKSLASTVTGFKINKNVQFENKQMITHSSHYSAIKVL